ncbi:transmembrane protein 272-like [Ciona intestinalis]
MSFVANWIRWVNRAICSTFIIVPMVTAWLVIPLTMIVVGILNLRYCSIEPNIPVWLVVGGFMVLATTTCACNCCQVNSTREEDEKRSNSQTICSILITIFHVIWFVIGNVWVIRIFAPVTQLSDVVGANKTITNGSNAATEVTIECSHITYYLAFTVIMLTYILLGILLLVIFISCFVCRVRDIYNVND